MSKEWDVVIRRKSNFLDLRFNEIWRYRDLLLLFVKRDFVSHYKQTILGPLWYLIQPILSTIIFTIIFGNIAKISTDGVPHLVFYLSGLTLWQYFADCLNATSSTFTMNQNIFGKVYFPRIIVPLSIVTSSLVKFTIQFFLFLSFVGYYAISGQITPNASMLLTPFLIIMMALMALGAGMIFSSLTTKYRDLIFLLTFGLQLLMYATPIIYPSSAIPHKFQFISSLNPLTYIIETFRYSYLGTGVLNLPGLAYSFGFTILIFSIGLVIFNKVEKTFMDTV